MEDQNCFNITNWNTKIKICESHCDFPASRWVIIILPWPTALQIIYYFLYCRGKHLQYLSFGIVAAKCIHVYSFHVCNVTTVALAYYITSALFRERSRSRGSRFTSFVKNHLSFFSFFSQPVVLQPITVNNKFISIGAQLQLNSRRSPGISFL